MRVLVCVLALAVSALAAGVPKPDDEVDIPMGPGVSYLAAEFQFDTEEDNVPDSEESGAIFQKRLKELTAQLEQKIQTMKAKADAKNAPARPHIVHVFADDLGYNDIGYNNPEVISPNLDALANDGVVLTQNYAYPVCTPSRHTFLTGKYAWKSKMSHGVLADPNPHCTPTDMKMLPEYLQELGYKTHMTGKWHVGFCKWGCTPTHRGFDSFYGLYAGMGDYYRHTNFGGYDWRDNDDLDRSADGKYATTLMRDRAVKIIEAHDPAESLFLWMTFTNVHIPLQIPRSYYDLYPDIPNPRRAYLALMTVMDDAIGDVIDSLKTKGMWEDTLFVFSSDNGGENGGASSNHPLRGSKGSMFEGGTRVVGFVSGDMVANKGSTNDGMIHVADWLPTLVSIAGGQPAPDVDGVDQSDMILNGGASKRDTIVYSLDMEHSPLFGQAAIRVGDYKLMWGHEGFSDGYGSTVVPFWMVPENLKLIGLDTPPLTLAQGGTHGPPHRRRKRAAYAYSVEEEDAQIAIMKAKMFKRNDFNSGTTRLFNVADDPTETSDLAADPMYADVITAMKERLVELIEEGYVGPPPEAHSFPISSMPFMNGGSWNPGWCEGADLSMATGAFSPGVDV